MVNPPIQGAGAPVLRDSAGSVTRFTSFSTRLRRASLRGAMALGALVFATGAWAQSADMVLSNHVVNPDPVPAGGIATITITVDNNGPNASSNVKVTDTIPAGPPLSAWLPATVAVALAPHPTPAPGAACHTLGVCAPSP